MNISSVNLEVSIPYLRIYGKGDKERIVAITDKTAEHQKDYLKVYHEVIDPDAPLIYTVIKGHKDRMSVGNVERIIKKYIAQIHSKNSAIPKYFFIMYDTVLSTELVIISIFFNSIDSPIYTF